MIFGIRAVIEAVEAGKDIDKILIKKDLQGELVQELFASVKGQNIVVQRVPIEKINRITRKNHQGRIPATGAVRAAPSLTQHSIYRFLRSFNYLHTSLPNSSCHSKPIRHDVLFRIFSDDLKSDILIHFNCVVGFLNSKRSLFVIFRFQ